MPPFSVLFRSGYMIRLILLLCCLLQIASAESAPTAQASPVPTPPIQAAPVQLLRISAISSGAPHVDFEFDADITGYTVSTYTVTTIINGNPTIETHIASLSQQNPKILSVPLKFDTYAAQQAQSVWISSTLATTANSSVLKTPEYILDLSFLSSIKTNQSAIASLLQTKQDLQSQLDSCSLNLHTASKHVNPNTFLPRDPALVGATTIILHFTTDLYATVQVSEPQTQQTVTTEGKEHYVKFMHLQPSTQYKFVAVPLDATTGKPIITMRQRIPQSTSPMVVFSPTFVSLAATGPTGLAATVNFDPNHALPANFKSYIRLFYKAQQPDGSFGQPISLGDGELDTNGVPKGTAYSPGQQIVPIPVPLANTAYLVMFKAYDQYGDESDSPELGRTTPAVTPAISFSGPISMTMNTNVGLTVSWKANRPVKTSTLQIKFADGTYLPNIPQATTGTTDSSVTIDLNGLSALLDKTIPQPGSTSPPAAKPPTFEISIDDGTSSPDGKASISFSVSFVITKATSPQNSLQSSANRVTGSAANGKSNISWKDVLSTGLGIIAKVI